MQKKIIPYGTANFEEIATQGYHYVDKTAYIARLEQVKFPVFLRPPRFGKSLLTEMLRCYYDIRMADRFEEIFGGLHAGRHPTSKRNSVFFMAFTFSGMDIFSDMEEGGLKRKFDANLLKTARFFMLYYKDLLGFDQERIDRALVEGKDDGVGTIQMLLSLVRSLGHRTYVPIDEYDSLTNALAIRYRHTGASDNMYLRILGKGGFFRNFFEMLKTESQNAIEQIYITGILPITLADMTSGYNIASWIHQEEGFVNMLGITQSEFEALVDEIYRDHQVRLDRELVMDTAKRYYDGYRFLPGAEQVYNPMMAMYFLNSVAQYGKFPARLADRNLRMNYDQVAFLFGQNRQGAKEIITRITEEREILATSDLQVSFDMKDFKLGKYIVEGLFYVGILTYGEQMDTLRIPNAVTYTFALDYFGEVQEFEPDPAEVAGWIRGYKQDGDAEALLDGFFRDVIQKFPGQFFATANESFFHGLLFSVLDANTQKDIYQVLPEFNLPDGRADLMVRTFPHAAPPRAIADLFEIKQVPKGAGDPALLARLREAVEQIRAYKTGPYAQWRGVAVCFRGNRDFRFEIV